MTVSKRTALGVLTRARLLAVAANASHDGLTGKRKEEIVEALASSRRAALADLLAHYSRDELKSACEAAGLSTKGREKAVIVERLLCDPTAPTAAPAQPPKPKSAPKKSTTRSNASLGFEQELWKTADLLRNNMDPAEYKHVVLGLLFLKYIEDAFEERRSELFFAVSDPSSEYYVPNEADREPEIAGLLEDPDEYLAANVFWVPEEARWSYLRSKAKQPEIGKLVDGAMDAIECDNPSLKGVLPKVYALPNLDKTNLGKLIDIVSGIGLGSKEHKDKDTLGRVYEYFLSRFASTEGRGGGEFYTPTSVVRLLVEMLEPYEGRVFDPCCGSGGMFVQSLKFLDAHGGKRDKVTVYGQESNYTTWRMAGMNLAIRSIEGEVADHIRDTVQPEALPSDTPYVGLEHVPRRCASLDRWGSAADVTSAKARFEPGDVLFGKLRPYFRKVVPTPCAGIASTDILVIRPRSRSWKPFVFEHLYSDAMVAHASAATDGTKMPRTKWADLCRFRIPMPPPDVAARFEEVTTPLLQRLFANMREARVLADLRDALLPKLISGELRVPEVAPSIGVAS